MNEIRIALIGTGGMGRKYAAMLIDGSVKSCRLTAVVCRSTEAKMWSKDTFTGSLAEQVKVYASSDEMFEEPEGFDAVLIVTPHKSHPELAIKAFSMGKHVFCDKPAGISVTDAKAMWQASLEAKAVYAMMFHQRLYDKYIRIKEILDEGRLGKINRVMLVNSRYFRTKHYHESGSWRSSWKGEGGGALINQGQHILDIWQWLFGMPESIFASIPFGKYNSFAVDDEVTLHMTYPDQMTAVFILTTGEAVWEERMEIIGSKGTLLMENNKLTITMYGEDTRDYTSRTECMSREGLSLVKSEETYPQITEEPYVSMFESFGKAVMQHEIPIATGMDGYHVLEITNAAYLSAWKHCVVDLPIHGQEFNQELAEKIKRESMKIREMTKEI